MPLNLLSTGGGGITLVSSNTGTNYIHTHPAETGTVITSGATSRIISRASMPSGSVIQTQYVNSGTRTTFNSTSFGEPSSAYRLSITPTSTSSLILLSYYIPVNPFGSYASNTIFNIRAFRIIGGSTSYALSSSGSSNGSRNYYAGIAFRPSGYDLNDPIPVLFNVLDAPNTTSQCTYGFQAKRETGGNGTLYFGYSGSDNGDWGWDTNILITAQEIAQ